MNKKSFIIGALLIAFLIPAVTFAQNPGSMLDDLQDKTNLIDFTESTRPWGNLTADESSTLEILLLDARIEDGTKQVANLKDLKTWFIEVEKIDPTRDPQAAFDKLKGLIKDDETRQILTDDKLRQIITEAGASGERQAYSIAITIAKTIRNLMASIAALWILIMGIQMVASQGEETKITELKTGITWALIGLGIILVAQPLIEAIYGAPGTATGLIRRTQLSTEINGIINFAKALLGAGAVFMIVLSGFKIITAQGDEEKIGQEKKAVTWVVIGLILVIINKTLIDYLFISPVESGDTFTQDAVKGAINVVGNVVQFLLGFLGLLALGTFVYGGATYIMNFGDEEASEKGKTMITNSVIGIVIILSAFAIVRTLIVQIP
jgi:hypothetical protein